jgi:hypothetical protein
MFQKASKTQSRLRLALIGPSGSGKTFSALAIASGLGKRIAVIDTERGSASKYAGRFAFDTLQLETFHPQRYIDAIAEAEKAGYDVLVIDSLSHAWIGREGALDLVDAAARRSKNGSSFNAWRDVTPLQHALVDAILRCKCHVIATMRSKVEYLIEKDEKSGRSVPRKIGMAPVQRDGVEYEFDVIGELDLENNLSVTKSRCPELSGTVTRRPGADFAKALAAWLSDGAAPVEEKKGNGTLETLPALDQVRALLDQAKSGEDLRALLPRIRALGAADRAKIRQRYADKQEELAHAANGQ